MISYEDTRHAVYDPHDPQYWDEQSLNKELIVTTKFVMAAVCASSFVQLFQHYLTALDSHADGVL